MPRMAYLRSERMYPVALKCRRDHVRVVVVVMESARPRNAIFPHRVSEHWPGRCDSKKRPVCCGFDAVSSLWAPRRQKTVGCP
jgi:hypothetical protein